MTCRPDPSYHPPIPPEHALASLPHTTMPILHFQNDTEHTLNIGVLFAGLPSVCHNELAPGAAWSQDFATVQFSSFAARVDNGENRFRRDDAAKDGT
jgi:hypothetical protein